MVAREECSDEADQNASSVAQRAAELFNELANEDVVSSKSAKTMRAADLPEAKQLGKRFLAVLRHNAGTAVQTGSEGWLPVSELLFECGASFDQFSAAVEKGGHR